MTLLPESYHFWSKEYPMFAQWAMQKDILFIPKEASELDEDKQYDLASKSYVFMKRLSQDYEGFMKIPSAERDLIFDMEMKLINEEAKKSSSNE